MLILAAEPLWIHKISVPQAANGAVFLHMGQKGYPYPLCARQFYDNGPIREAETWSFWTVNSWCNCWNGDQTELTNHAYESCMWTWTTTRIESACRNLSSPLKWSLFLTSSWEKSISVYPELKIALLLHGLQYCGLLKLRLKLNTIS